MTILDIAQEATTGARNSDYGSPLKNHSITAGLWSDYLGVDISPENVCFLNILQKISRTVSGRLTEDTLVDIAGYARNIEMMQEERIAAGEEGSP